MKSLITALFTVLSTASSVYALDEMAEGEALHPKTIAAKSEKDAAKKFYVDALFEQGRTFTFDLRQFEIVFGSAGEGEGWVCQGVDTERKCKRTSEMELNCKVVSSENQAANKDEGSAKKGRNAPRESMIQCDKDPNMVVDASVLIGGCWRLDHMGLSHNPSCQKDNTERLWLMQPPREKVRKFSQKGECEQMIQSNPVGKMFWSSEYRSECEPKMEHRLVFSESKGIEALRYRVQGSNDVEIVGTLKTEPNTEETAE